jgi:hypothetical protein
MEYCARDALHHPEWDIGSVSSHYNCFVATPDNLNIGDPETGFESAIPYQLDGKPPKEYLMSINEFEGGGGGQDIFSHYEMGSRAFSSNIKGAPFGPKSASCSSNPESAACQPWFSEYGPIGFIESLKDFNYECTSESREAATAFLEEASGSAGFEKSLTKTG